MLPQLRRAMGAAPRALEPPPPSYGLHLPPLTWGTQFGFSRDAVLFVYASDSYDPTDYIRDYEEFRRIRSSS